MTRIWAATQRAATHRTRGKKLSNNVCPHGAEPKKKGRKQMHRTKSGGILIYFMHPPRILIVWFPDSLLYLASAHARDGTLVWPSLSRDSWCMVLYSPQLLVWLLLFFTGKLHLKLFLQRSSCGVQTDCVSNGDLCITRREFTKHHWHSPFYCPLGHDYSQSTFLLMQRS
jgi:hypothetical protein